MHPSTVEQRIDAPLATVGGPTRRSLRPVPCTIPIRVDPTTGQFMHDPTTGLPIYERFLMTRKQVMGYLGVSSATVDRMVRAGKLSKPIKINEFTARWYSDEVAAVAERSRKSA